MSTAEKADSASVPGVAVDLVERAEDEPTGQAPVLTEEEKILEKKIVRKIDARLMPTTALIYLLCYIDRSNIGNAKILNTDTHDDIMHTNHMTTYQYTVALMLFLVAYALFEAPSNLMLQVAGPRRWLAFLVVCFGAFCAAIGGTTNAAGLTALRFFLGAAEAGIFPGMIYYCSFWYRSEERAARIAFFMCSATLAGAFGGCIAYGVGHLNGAAGLAAWRWLFLLEGLPAVLLGLVLFFWLPAFPEDVAWLSPVEKDLARRRLGLHGGGAVHHHHHHHHRHHTLRWPDARAVLADGRLWLHYLAYGCVGCGVGSLSLFAPTIVVGLGYDGLRAQLYTVPPYAAAYVFTLALSHASDRARQRAPAAIAAMLLGAAAYVALAALPAGAASATNTYYTARYALLCLACAGVFGCLPTLCAWVGDNARTTTAGALATALNVAVSGPGQIVGVWIYRAQDAPLYRLGHAINAAFLFLAALLCLALHVRYRVKNARLEGTDALRWAV